MHAAINKHRCEATRLQVVRCFEDDSVVHVDGRIDPVEDANVINYELALADLSAVEKRLDKAKRRKKPAWGCAAYVLI